MDDLGGSFTTILYIAFAVLVVIGQWKVNEKAGFPGWHAIVPFLNIYTLLRIAGKPGWWLILMFIPFVNIVAWVLAMLDLAKAFGRGTGFGIGLAFLSGLFMIILGFGEDEYQGSPGLN